MNLEKMRDLYMSEGFSYLEANSRTSQEVALSLIAKSSLAKNITIKGGVVIQHISGDSRRATQDFDLDFIRYSLSDESIKRFIKELNKASDEIVISITAPIEEMKHQDYSGKRVYISIVDNTGTSIGTKLDIGVHKNASIEQEEYCFELDKLDDSVCLLINTKEQSFAEKLKSLLRLGTSSTRYKDIFDMVWFTNYGKIDKSILLQNLEIIIFNDRTMRENEINDIVSRLYDVFNDSHFMESLKKSRRHNWLNIEPDVAAKDLLNFFLDFY